MGVIDLFFKNARIYFEKGEVEFLWRGDTPLFVYNIDIRAIVYI